MTPSNLVSLILSIARSAKLSIHIDRSRMQLVQVNYIKHNDRSRLQVVQVK